MSTLASSLVGRTVLVLALPLLACGGSAPTATAAPTTTAAARSTESPASPGVAPRPAPAAVTSLPRAKVKETIASGLGVFLQNVTLEDWPAMKAGRFHGFKIRAINPEWGVDVRPGDVVTGVNGMPIEHPEEADAALRSLEKAAAVRVSIERDGVPRVLELPIVD